MPPADPVDEGELFERLLALDHSRQEPWGPLHGVVVACHRLQQAAEPVRSDDQLVVQLQVYLDGGLPAVAGWGVPFAPSV